MTAYETNPFAVYANIEPACAEGNDSGSGFKRWS